ncbi:MAG: ribosome silencing factor [Sediminispirochaetaceae bacterium]
MVDTVKSKNGEKPAIDIARLIDDHKGEDTIVIDVSGESSWTDFFVISTINSTGHLKGVVRHIKQFLRESNLEMIHRHKRIAEDGWELMDCGNVVIHLMSKEIRDFYDLEKLWFNGKIVYQSSKSSKSSPSS